MHTFSCAISNLFSIMQASFFEKKLNIGGQRLSLAIWVSLMRTYH